jgi:putative SOS response-associated peptidase YedK
MCNTYNLRGNMKQLALFANSEPPPGVEINYESIHPDYVAPVIRRSAASTKLEIVMMRWGFPPLPGRREVMTNARSLSMSLWRPWLGVQHRCLIPATSFAEWTPEPNPETGKKETVWFGLNSNRSPFMFAGIWREWTGTRGTKKAPVEGMHLLFTFLTTEPNSVVKPIHSKSMPVILRSIEEWNAWLTVPSEQAKEMQKPLPDDAIHIVARATKGD